MKLQAAHRVKTIFMLIAMKIFIHHNVTMYKLENSEKNHSHA